MTDVTFTRVSADQLVAMGDGLAQAGHWKAARRTYSLALDNCAPSLRPKIQTRLALASTPNDRTPDTFALLLRIEETPEIRNVFIGTGIATWYKHVPALEDARFLEISDRHGHLLPLPNWHWNLSTALHAVRLALRAEGDLVELGVFKGHTTLFLADYLDFASLPRRWVLYDTFDGIPDDQLDTGWARNNAVYKGTYSYEEVRARFEPFPNIEVIKGRVPEALDGTAPEKIAFLHLDMNNATAEIAALDALFDRLSPGGVILFDDFCWDVSRAQRAAEEAWFAARGLEVFPLPTGQGLFVRT